MYVLYRSNNLPLLEVLPMGIDSIIPGVLESTSMPSYIHTKGIRRMLVSRAITPSFVTHIDGSVVAEFDDIEVFISSINNDRSQPRMSLVYAFANATLGTIERYIGSFLEDCLARLDSLKADDESLQAYSDAVVEYMMRFDGGESSRDSTSARSNTGSINEPEVGQSKWHRDVISFMALNRREKLSNVSQFQLIKERANRSFLSDISATLQKEVFQTSINDYRSHEFFRV